VTLKFPKRRKEITFWHESVGTPSSQGWIVWCDERKPSGKALAGQENEKAAWTFTRGM